jgi:hypothetical protein
MLPTLPLRPATSEAVWAQGRRLMGYPTPVGRCALRRVARAAQDGGVADVERRTAYGERDHVVDGQVGGAVGGTLVARAPVAVLTTPGAEHAGAEPLPGPRAVESVVSAAVGLSGVVGTPTAPAAGDDTADRAQLHLQIVRGQGGGVYPPRVLDPRVAAAMTRRPTRCLALGTQVAAVAQRAPPVPRPKLGPYAQP